MAVDYWRTRPSTLREAIDRMFDQAFVGSYAGTDNTGFQSVPVNVWETDQGFLAALLVPGVDEQSMSVTVQEDMLVIEGELRVQIPEGAKVLWQEFGPAKFRRTLRLGAAVDPGKVDAVYKNGLLMVSLPKADYAKPRQITVKVGQAANN